MPNEAALVRQPSVAAAVHQALPDMPVPPLTTPLSDSSSGSRDLAVSEGNPVCPQSLSLMSGKIAVRHRSLCCP